jgi:predicted nucleic acid-binding protein
MSAMLMLDTDVLIDIQRGHAGAVAWLSALTDVPLVPGYVVMEMVNAAQNSAQVQTAMRLVAPMPIVWPDEANCTIALDNFRKLHLSHGVGLLDSLIAATAVGRGATLCTFNKKHFSPIPGLTILEPYVR